MKSCGIPFRLIGGLVDHYFGVAEGARGAGRTLEAELISGFELGDWRDKVRTPKDAPYFVTAAEQYAWGGINRYSAWDQDLVRDRRAKDMRGKGVGLVTHFVKLLLARGVPIRLEQRGRWLDGRGRPGDRRANGGRHDLVGAKRRGAGDRRLRMERRADAGLRSDPAAAAAVAAQLDRRRADHGRGDRRRDPPHPEQPEPDARLLSRAGRAQRRADPMHGRHQRDVQPAHHRREQGRTTVRRRSRISRAWCRRSAGSTR